jgi:hypothetical protein
MGYSDGVNFDVLVGQTLYFIQEDSEEIIFETDTGKKYKMYHGQDCCESVSVEEIVGDLEDLIGSPILLAEEVCNDDPPAHVQAEREAEKLKAEAEGRTYWGHGIETWTFYKLSTIKGSVTIRWYGTSNGYYSEGVDFEEIK